MTNQLGFRARRIMACMFFGVLAVTAVWAERVTEADACAVANHFMNAGAAGMMRKGAPAKRMALKQSAQAEENLYYLYENADGEGWVIVAADDVVRPILAYSATGRFRTDNMPSNIKGWLRSYNDQIRHMVRTTPEASDEVKQEWTKYRKGARAPKASVIVAPLIKTGWSQGAPYNNLCPYDAENGGRSVTGCVATALAQVLYYHQWPEKGYGTHTHGLFPELTVDFSATTYDWDNMLYTYSNSETTAQKNAIATLMYHCGVAVDMQYSATASGAYTIDYDGYWSGKGIMTAETALTMFFGYKPTTVKGYARDNNWTKSKWKAMLKEELEAGRPIMYAGVGCDDPDDSSTCYGHSFVCDGYDSQDYFHFNFGWSNWCDGYYEIDALNTNDPGTGGGNGDYNLDQDVIIGIIPDRDPVHVTGVVVEPTTLTIKQKERAQLTATIIPDNATYQNVSWSSSDESIATVSAQGVVKGVSAGKATITAKSFDGNKTATCKVTVTNEVEPATELKVNRASAHYINSGEYWILVVTNSNTSVPWLQFYFDSGSSKKIAGTYDLAGGGAGIWDYPKEGNQFWSTSGQLNITCVSTGSGCNTYKIYSTFTGEDDGDYIVNATLEVCAQDENDKAITLQDNINDGQPVNITWMADGEEFTTTLVTNGKLTLPSQKPENCSNGKVFVGWCDIEEYEDEDEAPILVKNGDEVTKDTTLYAVYGIKKKNSEYRLYSTTCFSEEPIYFTITIATSEHGLVYTSPSRKTTAGRLVSITAEPDDKYELASLSVKDIDNSEVEVSEEMIFRMPASDVTVTCTFRKSTQGLDDVKDTRSAQKIVKDGRLLILRGDKTYSTMGQEIR